MIDILRSLNLLLLLFAFLAFALEFFFALSPLLEEETQTPPTPPTTRLIPLYHGNSRLSSASRHCWVKASMLGLDREEDPHRIRRSALQG